MDKKESKNFKQLIEKNLLGDMPLERRERLMSNFTVIDNKRHSINIDEN